MVLPLFLSLDDRGKQVLPLSVSFDDRGEALSPLTAALTDRGVSASPLSLSRSRHLPAGEIPGFGSADRELGDG